MALPCPGSSIETVRNSNGLWSAGEQSAEPRHLTPQIRPPSRGSSSYLGCALFKTLDDFLFANSELERFVSVSGWIEFLPILEHSYESKNKGEKSCGHESTPNSSSKCLKWISCYAQSSSNLPHQFCCPNDKPGFFLLSYPTCSLSPSPTYLWNHPFSPFLLPPPQDLTKSPSCLTGVQEHSLNGLFAPLLFLHFIFHTVPRMIFLNTYLTILLPCLKYFNSSPWQNPNAYMANRYFKIWLLPTQ